MDSIFELEGIRFDSDDKPKLGKFGKIPEIKSWLAKEAKDRFDLNTVKQSFGIAADIIGNPDDLKDNREKSKSNFCIAVTLDLELNGRKALIYNLLEGLKISALASGLNNEMERDSLVAADYDEISIDEMVTSQLIKFFFNYVDAKDKQRKEKAQGVKINPEEKFSKN